MAAPAEYWAKKPVNEMLSEAFRRIDAWYQHITVFGKLVLWRRSLREYYSGSRMEGEIKTGGDQDELSVMKVNHYHNLGEHVVTAISGQPPTALPQAANNDHESTSHTIIAGAILEAAVTQKGLDEVFTNTTRRAWTLSEGWASAEWDSTLGEPYVADPTTNSITKTGDWRIRTYVPADVVRDYMRDSAQDHEWYILRRFENRYNVMARATRGLPDDKAQAIRESIAAAPSKMQENTNRPRISDLMYQTANQDVETDEIAVYELRHAKTDAMPNGRRTVFVTQDVYLSDGDLPFRNAYVFGMRPEEEIGAENGYTQGYDLLAPQHGVNAAYSSVVSALAALGHAVIHKQPGSSLTVEELKPFSLVTAQGELKAVPLLPPEAVAPHTDFANAMTAQMEIISGVNAVRRGNLEATGKLSGSAYALIDAKFLESVVGLQRSFKNFASQVFTAIVELYQDFAKVEQTVKVAGKSSRVYAKEFTGDSIKKVLRVDIEMADPLSRTTSGRMQVAQMLMGVMDADGRPVIKTPEQFMQVIRTGRLEPLTEGQGKELDNIKAENEMLGDGKTPQSFIFDNHPLHIQEHYCVVASPEARAPGSPVAAAALAHIQEHLDQWNHAPLDGLAARKIPPPPSMSMMPPPGAPPSGGPPGPGGAPGGEPSVPGPEGAPPQPKMPQMPRNPQTGERAPMPPS